MNNSLNKLKFIEKINDLIKEMEQFHKTESSHWKDSYDIMLEDLKEVISITRGNMVNGEEKFNEIPIVKFSTFKEYVTNTDPSYLKETSGTNSRFKSSRAKRKRHSTCPQCGEKMTLVDNQFKCEKCLCTIDVKSGQTGLISGEDSKHPNKLLHTIAGIGKPPGSVQKILNHTVTWLTDLRYIKEWFIAHKDRYEEFSNNYKRETGSPLSLSFFERKIERKKENVWQINIYHLLMNEFQQMLEEAKAISRITSNMKYLNKDDIISIVEKYRKEHGNKIPEVNAKINEHEIGAYFAELSLIPVFTEDHVKHELEKMYNKSLSMAGLSFNFNETFKQSETIIRRYDLLQGNSWIQRYVFNVPPSTITEIDLTNILSIMLQFNIYYKEFWYKQKLKSCNSPLFPVVLDMILNLPAFKRFKPELMIFIQKKELKTRTQISNTWMRFEQEKGEFLSRFIKARDQQDIMKEISNEVQKDKTQKDEVQNEDVKNNIDTDDTENEDEENIIEEDYEDDVF